MPVTLNARGRRGAPSRPATNSLQRASSGAYAAAVERATWSAEADRRYRRFNSRARRSAWVRLSTASLPKMLLTCFLTVLTATISVSAIA